MNISPYRIQRTRRRDKQTIRVPASTREDSGTRHYPNRRVERYIMSLGFYLRYRGGKLSAAGWPRRQKVQRLRARGVAGGRGRQSSEGRERAKG